MSAHCFFWLFCPSCRHYQGTAFLLLRAALKKISTDLGTITVPSPLHLLLSGPADSSPGEFNPLFCGRFGQSGIKCRPLLTLWASVAVASGDSDFVFSHTSLLGTWGFAVAGRARKRHWPPVHLPEAGLDLEGATGWMSNVFFLPGLAFISFVLYISAFHK